MSEGLIHILTGEGKGKTTSSVGVAVRAAGAGKKVLYCSFYKPDGTSEHEPLVVMGVTLKRFSWRGDFFKKYTPQEMEEQKVAFKDFLAEVKSEWNNYDFIILDEVVYAIKMEVISEEEFKKFIEAKPEKTELILTGRDFPPSIIEKADYVTEMKQIKHPFNDGTPARKGVEY